MMKHALIGILVLLTVLLQSGCGSSGPAVTYEANFAGAGSQRDPASPYAPGALVTVRANPFARPGWTFLSWNTKADGTGTAYAIGATFVVNAETVLYARWAPEDAVPTASGVAPLAVYFDATDVTSPTTTRPFHELEYRWDFGDGHAGQWLQGVNAATSSKNRATGPVSAHVYETPGDYTATLSIFDGSTTRTRTYSVTVTNPETVFASNTTCVSADGDFTGAPACASQVTSTQWNATIDAALASGSRRILFKRGQNFNATNGVIIPDTGANPQAIVIGAFGPGVNPPQVKAVADSVSIFHVAVKADLRLMDFDVDGQLRSSVRAMTVGAGGVLALRINAKDLGYLGSISGNKLAIVDSSVSNIVGNSGVMPIYIQDGFHLFIAGNRIDSNGGGEYALRYQGGTHGVISHNSFLRCGDNKQMLTLRGDYTQTTYLSGKHVVSDNLVDGSTSVNIPVLSAIVPQNRERNERITDVIVERNLFVAAPGQMTHLMIAARDVTVRNNLFNATGAGTGPMLSMSWGNNQGGLPKVAGIQIYHNTFFSGSSGGVTAVGILNQGEPVEDTVVKNNFLYAPNTVKSGENNGGPLMLVDNGVRTLIGNNSTNAKAKSPGVPPFAVVPPTSNPADWSLAAGCYGIGSGGSVPVWSDFFEKPQLSSSSRNIGAVGN